MLMSGRYDASPWTELQHALLSNFALSLCLYVDVDSQSYSLWLVEVLNSKQLDFIWFLKIFHLLSENPSIYLGVGC